MKKLILCSIMLLLVLGATSCSKEELFITTDDISADTLLAKANGQLQVATVEEFDKSYYDLTELEDFVTQEIEVYNQTAGEAKITFDDVQLSSGKVIMLLTYTGMDQYSAFNEVPAAYFNGGVKNNPLDMPATLINKKNESLVSTEEVLQNAKYKVLVMNEPYDIIVDGKIKYYSENSKLVDDNKIQCAAEGMTVIVFKP